MTEAKRHIPPAPTRDGQPEHGASADEGVVLRAHSKGPGVAVEVRNPLGPPPRRVVSGAGDIKVQGGRLYITPSVAALGDEFTLTVEY
jgi:hypothetical protein